MFVQSTYLIIQLNKDHYNFCFYAFKSELIWKIAYTCLFADTMHRTFLLIYLLCIIQPQ